MRHRAVAAMAVSVALLGWTGGAHRAAADQGRSTCRFSFYASLSPGLSGTPGSGTITTGGQSGTLQCTGPVEGADPNGRGVTGVEGRYGVAHANSCLSAITGDGDGAGMNSLTIPTTAGTKDIGQTFTFTYGGKPPSGGGFVSGEFKGPRFSGSFEITPVDGDCISAPVTKVHVTGEGVLQ
jgi:hypothetical protein